MTQISPEKKASKRVPPASAKRASKKPKTDERDEKPARSAPSMRALVSELRKEWRKFSRDIQVGIAGATVALATALVAAWPFGTIVSAILFVGVGVGYFVLRENEPTTKAPSARSGKNRFFERLGSFASMVIEPDHIERRHRFDLLHRIDLLDHGSKDFYSIRRIRGVNVSNGPTAHILYVEHSERRCNFIETGVVAFDAVTRKPLIVTSLLAANEKSFRHAFKIHFPAPLAAGAAFDIVFAIRLPGELGDLSHEDEIMSVFLGRVAHGVGELIFDLCLDFEPRTIEPSCVDKDERDIPADGEVEPVTAYTPEHWFEETLGIVWSDPAFRVRWRVNNPKGALYVLHYIR